MKAQFFCTIDAFNKLDAYYLEKCEVIHKDSEHVMGFVDLVDCYGHLAGEDISGINLRGYTSLWFSPSGKVHYVPGAGHDFTAIMLGYNTIEDLERAGWVHLSSGSIYNYHLAKITDRCYDALARYCEQNYRPMFKSILLVH